MSFLLPLVALALAIAAPFVLRQERPKADPLRWGVLALLVLAAGLVVFRAAPEIDRTPALIGLVLGALACALGSWGGGLAFGVAAASALHLLPATSLPTAGLALAAGTGLGALVVGGEASALAAVLVVAADNLGLRHSQTPAFSFVGSQIGLALAVGSFLSIWVPEKYRLAKPLAPALATLGGIAFLSGLNEPPLGICIAIGAIGGLILHGLMPEEEGESSRVALAAVVGVGLATVSFGLGKGVGMALTTLAVVGVLLAAENRRAVLALGPLVGLLLFRVLREAGTGATRALDLGQHYTLLALVLGLALPLLPTDWLRGRVKVPFAAGSLLWGLVAIAAAPLVVVALGMRGGIGFVVGLGVAGLIQAMRTTQELRPLALGAGLGGGTILALAWIGDDAAISRDQKVHLFAYAAIGIAMVVGLLALAGRKKEEQVS